MTAAPKKRKRKPKPRRVCICDGDKHWFTDGEHKILRVLHKTNPFCKAHVEQF
jgi:hypothetical protein